jgi:hypothetical protein
MSCALKGTDCPSSIVARTCPSSVQRIVDALDPHPDRERRASNRRSGRYLFRESSMDDDALPAANSR